MFKRFTHNWGIKLACILAASFLWIYVSASQNNVGKFPSSLKIRAINTPAGTVAIYDTKTVDIKIMAEPSVWRKLSADSFSAYIDLTGLANGTYELPVNVVSSIPGVQIVERSPENLFITLEQLASKKVNISRRIEGSAGEGLVPGSIELAPDQVEVKGAKSLIDGLTEATVVITLNGESEEFQKTVPIVILDDKGEVVKDIEIVPSETKARVPIVKASNNKTVGVKVNVTGTPKSGYYVSNVDVTPSIIDIVGSRAVLADVNYVETYAVDVSNATADIEQDVLLNTGNGVALQAGAPNKVKVKITISPTDISKELTLAPSFENLDAILKVSTVMPNEVRVICSGSAEAINNLKASDLALTIDLKGRGAGIISLDLSASNIKTPQGVVVTSILPSALAITIDKK